MTKEITSLPGTESKGPFVFQLNTGRSSFTVTRHRPTKAILPDELEPAGNVPTVYHQLGTGDPFGLRASEESNSVRDVPGLSEPW